MAKHAHKLILINGKTWKCALPGCRSFWHLGLAHVLIGGPAKCWQCNSEYTITEESLKTGKSVCYDCDAAKDDTYGIDMVDIMEARAALGRDKVKHINEITQIGLFQIKHKLTDGQIKYLKDMEIIQTKPITKPEHRDGCAIHLGMACDCKDEVDYT